MKRGHAPAAAALAVSQRRGSGEFWEPGGARSGALGMGAEGQSQELFIFSQAGLCGGFWELAALWEAWLLELVALGKDFWCHFAFFSWNCRDGEGSGRVLCCGSQSSENEKRDLAPGFLGFLWEMGEGAAARGARLSKRGSFRQRRRITARKKAPKWS